VSKNQGLSVEDYGLSLKIKTHWWVLEVSLQYVTIKDNASLEREETPILRKRPQAPT